jgi:5-methylcytosine-specific restriction endonuclease McrA
MRPASFKPPALARPRRRDESKKERDAFYSSARWMWIRRVFLDANPLCEPCLDEDIVTPATIAHHRVERLADPSLALDPSNLVAMCDSCHTRHHKRPKNRPGGG